MNCSSLNIYGVKRGRNYTHENSFFCDPGIDDSLAIMYSILDPEIELVGIVTSYGNVTQDQATATAAYLLKLGGKWHPNHTWCFKACSRRSRADLSGNTR